MKDFSAECIRAHTHPHADGLRVVRVSQRNPLPTDLVARLGVHIGHAVLEGADRGREQLAIVDDANRDAANVELLRGENARKSWRRERERESAQRTETQADQTKREEHIETEKLRVNQCEIALCPIKNCTRFGEVFPPRHFEKPVTNACMPRRIQSTNHPAI